MISAKRECEIRENARALQNDLWRRRAELLSVPPALPQYLFPLKLKEIVTKYLGASLEQPDYIPCDVSQTVTAGLMDRERNRITIALNFPIHQRRFTTAHEIGHWRLHPGMSYHHTRVWRRDRPLSGPDRSKSRPREEQEADLFAAELLMPRKLLSAEFTGRFGGPVTREQYDEELAIWVSSFEHELTPFDLTKKLTKGNLAYRLGQATSYRGMHFDSLTARFEVSAKAMAIQLLDIAMVS